MAGKDSWLSRNWKWAATGCGCAALLGAAIVFASCMGAGAVGAAALAAKGIKETDAYRNAIDAAKGCSLVQAELGAPVEDGLIPTKASISEGASEGSADFEARLSGPRGSGTLVVSGVKTKGDWSYRRLDLIPKSSGKPIDLLSAGAAKRAPSDAPLCEMR